MQNPAAHRPTAPAARRDISLAPQVRNGRIPFPTLVDHDRTVRGLLGIDQGWQRLDLYFDQVQGFLGDIDVVRGHRGNRVAMVAHHVGRNINLSRTMPP